MDFNSRLTYFHTIYDTLGRLIETNQGVQVRKFKYDSLGRLTRQKLAEQTATINDAGVYVGAGNGAAVWSEAFVYDNRSNLVQKTDARNVKSNYTYTKPDATEDALNRIRKISYDISGATNVLPAPDVTYSYMATGDKARILQIRTAGLLTEDFSYDSEGRLDESTEKVDARPDYPMTMTYVYDSLDRTTEVWYPEQYGLDPQNILHGPRKKIEPTYDTASRLSTLKVNGVVQAGDIVYNSSDQTESIKVGVAGTNQVTEKYTYDSMSGLLTNQKVIKNDQAPSQQTLLDLSYDYARNNSIGNLNGKTGHLTKTTDNLNNAKNKEYEYDALGRLTKAKGGSNLWTQTYTYDRFGNRTNVAATGNGIDGQPMQKDGIGNLNFGATPDSSLTNRITTTGWEYDVAGNLTRGLDQNGVWLKYEYDAANRLQVIKKDSDNSYVQAFQFGSTNQRLMDIDYGYGYLKIIGAGGAVEYTEFAGAVMTWTKSYTYLGDSILSIITPNGSGGETTEFNHPDRLGTRVATNQQTGTSSEQASLPFGTALGSETTPNNNTKKFTSYERSAGTGLDYAINRTYDSKLGSFTQVDPIGMSASNLMSPQSLNLYSYCGNDPINRTDPNGLFWGSFFKILIKILRIVAVVIAVAVAVITAIYAPYLFATSLKALFGLVATITSATSEVLSFAGYSKAAGVFSIISAAASFGTSLLNFKPGVTLIARTRSILAVISSAATLATRVLSQLGHTLAARILNLVASVSGGLSKGKQKFYKWYKFIRSTAQAVATLAGATKFANFLDYVGLIDNVADSIVGIKDLLNFSRSIQKSGLKRFGKVLYLPVGDSDEDLDGDGLVDPWYSPDFNEAKRGAQINNLLKALRKINGSTLSIVRKVNRLVPAN